METNSQSQLACKLAKQLGKEAHLEHLTTDGALWFIYEKGKHPTPDAETFQDQWQLHPEDFHRIKVAGKDVQQSRFHSLGDTVTLTWGLWHALETS